MKSYLFFLPILVSLSFSTSAQTSHIKRNHCSSSESWVFSDEIDDEWRTEYLNLVHGKISPIRSFAEALSLRRRALSPETKYFAEYWISRSLLEGGVIHLAHKGFLNIVGRPIEADVVPIQVAAIACLNRIHIKYPTLEFSEIAEIRILEESQAFQTIENQSVLWEASLALFLRQPNEESIHRLDGSGAYEFLAQGLWKAKTKQYSESSHFLKEFLSTLPSYPNLNRYRDIAYLTLGRSLYAIEAYQAASEAFKKVEKTSNLATDSIRDLAWAQLLAHEYNGSIGAALSLQAGLLRSTFAPEGPMVMAMALNELCQYPDSLRAINYFKRTYQKPYDWLSTNRRAPDLYGQTIEFIRGKSKVPSQIGNQWIKSARFIANQKEINLIIDQPGLASKLGKIGAKEQVGQAQRIRRLVKKIKTQIIQYRSAVKRARAQGKRHLASDDELPDYVYTNLARLRKAIIHYKRFRAAAPVFKKIMTHSLEKSSSRQNVLVAQIDQELRDLNRTMLHKIDEIMANNQLIEVEIYSGASQDIIWKNANPEYESYAKKMNRERKEESEERTWNWGTKAINSAINTEIWEDEVGTFQTDLYDNCSNKNKYLALKSKDLGV